MRTILKLASIFALAILYSCTKGEEFNEVIPSESGVYGFPASIVIEDDPATRATFSTNPFKYVFEIGDRINIWSESGTLLIYKVQSVKDNGRAEFTGGGYTLSEGETYFSSHPLIKTLDDDHTSLTTSYEGQAQAADNDADHIADYAYTYSSGTCSNGNTSFNYQYVCSFFLFNVTLPDALTLTELSITSTTEDFFSLSGKTNMETGEYIPGDKKSSTMTLKLGGDSGIQVSDKVLNAFLSLAPCGASDYVVRVKDSDGKVYSSPVIHKSATTAGNAKQFNVEVYEGEEAPVFVAQIGDTKYETFEEAWNAVEDGQTITLLADCAGNGIIAPQGKFTEGVTVDFGGFTYTMDGNMVGSTGTQTQACQLLKDNKITFKNGTVYSEKALFLVQNYSDLTLDNMTLTLNNAGYTSAYTLSNNNGNVVINNTTINANTAGGFAFDVCRYSSYPSVNVTVKGESVINGDIEVSASSSDPKDGFGLNVESGTVNGNLVIDATAKTAMESAPEKTEIKKATSNPLEAPEGFVWVDNGDGTSTLKIVVTTLWQRVTSPETLDSGKYILVYPDGTTYKLFSFEKTMENAQEAFAMMKDKHSFEEVLPMRTELFQTTISKNYQTVTAEEGADQLLLPEDIANEVSMEATTNPGETCVGSVLLKSSVHNLNVTTALVELADDNSVIIKSQINATDFDNILTTLRGHQISVTFANLVDFAGKKVGMSQASIANTKTAFDNLCSAAKDILNNHGYSLMDITRDTRVLDVFVQYYDNLASASLQWNDDVAFGWVNPIGFYSANDGFSAHIPMPSSIWFTRLNESLHYGEGGKNGFVAYWKRFDQNYPKYAEFAKGYTNSDELFGRLAEKFVEGDNISDALFAEIANINWAELGKSYQRYADSLNGDPLEKVYLYKYVGE
jgi:hypothetical protein